MPRSHLPTRVLLWRIFCAVSLLAGVCLFVVGAQLKEWWLMAGGICMYMACWTSIDRGEIEISLDDEDD